MEALYLIAVIKPALDRTDEVLALARTMVAETLKEPGCEFYDLVVAEDEPDTWLMLEKWSSRDHWNAHMESDHVRAGNKAFEGKLRAETELRFYGPR